MPWKTLIHVHGRKEVSPSSHATTNRGVSELSSKYYKSEKYGECKIKSNRAEVVQRVMFAMDERFGRVFESLGKGVPSDRISKHHKSVGGKSRGN